MNVSASMICYHSAPTIVSALESIYPHVADISIAYGPLADWPFRSDDGTLALLNDFPDPDRKVSIMAAEEWPGRLEMRQATARRMWGDYHLMVDSDEVWADLGAWMDWAEAEHPTSAYAPWVTPFRGMRHWVYCAEGRGGHGWGGGRLGGGLGSCRQRYQFSRWDAGSHWAKHWFARDAEGRNLFRASRLKADLPTRLWHFGWALPARYVREKVRYYQDHCPGLPAVHRLKERQKEQAWFDWDGRAESVGVVAPGDTVVAPLPNDAVPARIGRSMERIRSYYDDEDLTFEGTLSGR